MTVLRGFLADDDPETMESVANGLQFEFASMHLSVEFEKYKDPLEGRKRIKNGEPFDFAIVDLYFASRDSPPPGQLYGYVLVEDLRYRASDLTFVVLSTGYSENEPSFIALAQGAGAHLALNRGQMAIRSEWGPDALARRIRDHLIDSGRLPIGSLVADPADPGLSSVLALLAPTPKHAQRVIRNLISKCLDWDMGQGFELTLHYLAQGRSGARVLRVRRAHPAGPADTYVLKISLDGRALQEELRANRQAVATLPHDALMSLQGKVERHAQTGFFGVVGRMADTEQTLAEFLDEAARTDVAEELAKVLIGDYLSKMYCADRSARTVEGLSWMRLSKFQQVRTLEALRRLAPAFSDRRAAALVDAETVLGVARDFINLGTIPGGFGHLPTTSLHMFSFGDLHARNIMVREGTRHRPVLIDASEFGVRHWASDAARLVVDVLLRCHNAGVSAMTWDDFPTARATGAHLCPVKDCCTGAHLDPATASEALIGAVLDCLPRAIPFREHGQASQAWHWQWHVALARELLRQGAHEDVMPARRVLAITLVHDHLTRAADLLTGMYTS